MIMASKSYEKHSAHKALYDALIQSLFVDEDDMDRGKTTKRRRTKESEPSMKSSISKETSKGNASPKASKTDKPVNAKETVAEPTEEVTIDAKENIVNDMGNTDEQPDGEAALKTNNALKNDWFKQPLRPPTPDSEWNKGKVIEDGPEQTWFNDLVSVEKDPLIFDELIATPIEFSKFAMNRLKLDKITKADLVGLANPEGDRCIYDLSKPLPLKGRPVKVGYNKDAEHGISHWGPKRQLFYRSQINRLSRHDVYSTLKILSVVSVTINKQFSYGNLKEIVVRRAYRKLYTLKEGDFINLYLNDIEDILLLVFQHKLFHLDGVAIIDLAVALRMFTRRIVIQKRVKDVQLGVESYQKKLNITKPQKDFPTISAKEPYTPSFDPPGVVYEDLSN
ncbi:hypothetical protein Tco_1366014 [Tanacetum coccineum]